MHVGEALDVTHQIVSNDVSNRVVRILRRIEEMSVSLGRDPKKHQPLVGYFEVDEEIGVLRPMKSFRRDFRRWEDAYALHFVEQCFHADVATDTSARYVYWFNVRANEFDYAFWNGWSRCDSTFKPTNGLMKALWKEAFYSHGSTLGLPRREGFDLVDLSSQRGALERLALDGIRFKLANYQKLGEVKSLDRQISDGFITSVQLPGTSYWWETTTVEGVLTLLNRIHEVKFELQDSVRTGPVKVDPPEGTSEHSEFLEQLKSECYAIKSSYGNHTGKAAFDVYNRVAKYLLREHKAKGLVKRTRA